jgi:hypothetical protein
MRWSVGLKRQCFLTRPSDRRRQGSSFQGRPHISAESPLEVALMGWTGCPSTSSSCQASPGPHSLSWRSSGSVAQYTCRAASLYPTKANTNSIFLKSLNSTLIADYKQKPNEGL